MMPTPLDVIATFVLTYAAHSVVACLLALAAKRLWQRPHDRDLIWKTALVAPIVTATLAVSIAGARARANALDVSSLVRHVSSRPLAPREVAVVMMRTPLGTNTIRRVSDPVASSIALGVAIVAALCVTLAIVRVGVRRRTLRRMVGGRRADGAVSTGDGRPVVVSIADELHTPVALGANEICLPTEVASGFTESHRRALIAHESAHLERRDPLWFAIVDVIAALSSFQPLVFVVVRAFRRDVELICDETAIRATGDRSALLGALALLASPFDPRSPLAAASAYDGSPLVARATRIASVALEGAQPRAKRRVLAIAAVVMLGLLGVPVVAPLAAVDELPSAASGSQYRKVVRIRDVRSTTGDEDANVHRSLRIVE